MLIEATSVNDLWTVFSRISTQFCRVLNLSQCACWMLLWHSRFHPHLRCLILILNMQKHQQKSKQNEAPRRVFSPSKMLKISLPNTSTDLVIRNSIIIILPSNKHRFPLLNHSFALFFLQFKHFFERFSLLTSLLHAKVLILVEKLI